MLYNAIGKKLPASKTRNNHFTAWGKPMLSMHPIIKLNGNVAVGLSLCCTADRARASYNRGADTAIRRAQALTLGSLPLKGQFVFSHFDDFNRFRKLLREAERTLGSNAAYHFYRETFFNTPRGALAKLGFGLSYKQMWEETKKALHNAITEPTGVAKSTAEYDRGFIDGVAHAADHMEAWNRMEEAKELRAFSGGVPSRFRIQDHADEFAEAFIEEYLKLFGTVLAELSTKHSLAQFVRVWKPRG